MRKKQTELFFTADVAYDETDARVALNSRKPDGTTKFEQGFVVREPRGRSFTLRTTKKFLLYFGEGQTEQKKLPIDGPTSTG